MDELSAPGRDAARQRQVAALASLSLVLFVLLLVANFRATADLSQAVAQLENAQEREQHLLQVAEGTLELQAARRGYILTGEDRFLLSFDQTADAVAQAMASLQAEAAAGAAFDGSQVAGYIQGLRDSVALHRRDPAALQEQQDITLQGDTSSRAIYQQLDGRRDALARQRDQDSRWVLQSTQRMQVYQTVLAATGLLLLVMAGLAFRSQSRLRLQAQQALQRSNAELEQRVAERTAAHEAAAARYRRVVDLSADGIVLCAADGTVLYANPSLLALTEHEGDQALLGRPIDSLLTPGAREALGTLLEPLWHAPGQLAFTEAAMVTARGRHVAVRLGAVSYLEHEALRMQLVLHDVSQLREEEAARLEQLHFIDQLFEAIPAPLSVRDERGTYLRVNRAYEDLYQRPRAQLLRRSVFDVFDPGFAHDVASHDHAAMRTAQPLTYESQLRRLDAPQLELLTGVRAFRRSDGSVIGVIAVETDVTEMRRQRNELQQTNAEREQLSQRLIRSQEEERRRIARDLHDQVGQILTALKISLDLAAIAGGAPRALFERPSELADEALRQVRTLTSSLHPHMLEDLGLEAAVRWLAERYVQPAVKLIELDILLSPPRGRAVSELVAFRVVQEALTNVLRHAQAQRVGVSLHTEGDQLLVDVQDDGRGFDASVSRSGQVASASLGLSSMRERLSEVGGRVVISSTGGRGTRVRAEIPW